MNRRDSLRETRSRLGSLADGGGHWTMDDGLPKGGAMEIFWTSVSIAFVVFTLAVGAFAAYRFLGGGNIPQH